MEGAEQKQTHGSGRILKPGPCSIKASLGPSSLEDPPPLLSSQHSGPVDILPLFLLPPSASWSSVEQLPLCCLPALSLSSPALPASLHRPPSSLHLLLHHYDCSGGHERDSKKERSMTVSPCLSEPAVVSSSEPICLILLHHVIFSQRLIGAGCEKRSKTY